MNFVLSHPWLLALILPSALAAAPGLLVKLERAALKKLFVVGDSTDQKCVKGVAKCLVLWAEEKYDLAGSGAQRFEKVNMALAHALPFLSAEQREKLIEDAVAQLDAEAQAQISAPSAAAAAGAVPAPQAGSPDKPAS